MPAGGSWTCREYTKESSQFRLSDNFHDHSLRMCTSASALLNQGAGYAPGPFPQRPPCGQLRGQEEVHLAIVNRLKWIHSGTASSLEGFLEGLMERRGFEQRYTKKADSQQRICRILTKVLGIHEGLISAMTSTLRQMHFRLALLQSRITRSKTYTGTISSQKTQTTKRSPPRGVVNRLKRVHSGIASSAEGSSEPNKRLMPRTPYQEG